MWWWWCLTKPWLLLVLWSTNGSIRGSTGLSFNVERSTTATSTNVDVIPPGQSFRSTDAGEVSIVSMNLLAPSYHYLSIHDDTERLARIQHDRQTRVPLAFQMAKQSHADILCLQEVEGLEELQASLADNDADSYDAHVWSPLHPKSRRKDDVVGLCIAWRSQRHQLVQWEGYQRGMVVQLQDLQTGATISIANLHLHAKASALPRRLKTMTVTLEKLQQLQSAIKEDDTTTVALDGTMFICGDFNSNQQSVTHRLLTTGRISYGTIRDRNYKTRLSRDAAKNMRHSLLFHDIYDDKSLRSTAAPITVSLSGRKPACMDHLLYCQKVDASLLLLDDGISRRPPTVAAKKWMPDKRKTKRLARRQKGKAKEEQRHLQQQQQEEEEEQERLKTEEEQETEQGQEEAMVPSTKTNISSVAGGIKVEAVLATVDEQNNRMQTILDGLPNVEAGFPSDHLPIGALFVPSNKRETKIKTSTTIKRPPATIANTVPMSTIPPATTSVTQDKALQTTTYTNNKENNSVSTGNISTNDLSSSRRRGSLSANARRRREVYAISVQVRKRHNVILGQVVEWLTGRLQATQMIRDTPLYDWKWLRHSKSHTTKKLRAPDICCVLQRCDVATMVIVEVTVGKASKTTMLRRQKQRKYEDLAHILRQSESVQTEQLRVCDRALVIVLDEDGNVPDETRKDLMQLVQLSNIGDDVSGEEEDRMGSEVETFCNHLQQVFVDEDLRVEQ